jgi:type I restriction enzyme R subunit/putative DNA methylase
MPAHRGWYSRGYLPHFDAPSTLQALTFRLADSLPAEVVGRLLLDCPDDDPERRRRIEAYLDAGHGACVLREHAAGIEDALLANDGTDYRLLAWVVMPNHVHVLIELARELDVIVQAWKSVSAHRILAHCRRLGRTVPAPLWQREYWDRWIRDERHYRATLDYIARNPVSAGLCDHPAAWPWSSAAAHRRGNTPAG